MAKCYLMQHECSLPWAKANRVCKDKGGKHLEDFHFLPCKIAGYVKKFVKGTFWV